MTAGDGPASKVPRTQEVLQVKKLSEHAVLPVRGSPGAAGEFGGFTVPMLSISSLSALNFKIITFVMKRWSK